MHGGRSGIFVERDHYHSITLQFNCHFFSKLAASEQQSLLPGGREWGSDFKHVVL